MNIPGNHNQNDAKLVTTPERCKQIVQGSAGSRMLRDQKNEPHTVTDAGCQAYVGGPTDGNPSIPGNHNQGTGGMLGR